MDGMTAFSRGWDLPYTTLTTGGVVFAHIYNAPGFWMQL